MPNPKKEKGAVPFENTRPCESHTSQCSAPPSSPVFPQPNSIREAALRALDTGPIRQSGFQRSWRLAEYVLDLQDTATASAAARFRSKRGAA
jgi:hypothetical protein